MLSTVKLPTIDLGVGPPTRYAVHGGNNRSRQNCGLTGCVPGPGVTVLQEELSLARGPMENQTASVTEFILLGLPLSRQVELLFLVLLLPTFLLTLLGNLLIICAILPPPPHPHCYFYFFLGTVEFLLLTVTSCDRYATICYPLRYSTIMRPPVCIGTVGFSWVGGFLSVLFPTNLISQLPFCDSNIINHFFCDSGPLLALACADTTAIELMDFMFSSMVILCCIVLVAYSFVISGSITVFIYVTPSQKDNLEINKVPSVLSSVVAPFLNPFIHTLRNEMVLGFLRDVWVRVRAVWGKRMRTMPRGRKPVDWGSMSKWAQQTSLVFDVTSFS
ncbi:olfactory receptor 6J1-like protein [Camelus ferus]|nr:olfactory receptor 6J1-like protein [Camelus ferus]